MIEESRIDIQQPLDVTGNYQFLDQQVSEIGRDGQDDDFNSERADSELLDKDREEIA